MNRLLFLLLLTNWVNKVHSQVEQPAMNNPSKVYEIYDAALHPAPIFPGGDIAMRTFIFRNLSYPSAAKEKNIKGLVMVNFIIDESGSVTDAITIQNPGGGLAEEVLRIVRMMPKWAPGMVDGKAVKVKYSYPFNFRLE